MLRLMTEQPASWRGANRWWRAVRVLSERPTDVPAALDRFVLHATELGVDQATKGVLLRGRAKLAADLGDTLHEVEQASALIGHRRSCRRRMS